MPLRLQKFGRGSTRQQTEDGTRDDSVGQVSDARRCASGQRIMATISEAPLHATHSTATATACSDLLDYIATMADELSGLAQNAGQDRVATALRIAEQEARLQLLRWHSMAARQATPEA